MKLGVTLDVLNQRATPAFYADTLANRPAAGFAGRVFISTDTFDLYRDNGSTWDLLSPANAGTITGGGSLYRVGIWTSTSNLGESNNLVFDYSLNRLGINTNAPTASLDVHGTTNVIAQLNQLTTGQNALLTFQDNSVGKWRLGNIYNAAANDFGIVDILNSLQRFTIKNTGQTFVGTETTSSGLFVVNSSTADNQIVAIGANAPSIRINNGSAAKQVGIGISTATNNFIQGSADRDFCIFNGSTTAASPMLFGIYDAGLTNVQEAARISAARNFLVGTSVDAGNRLEVRGNARIVNTNPSITSQVLTNAETTQLILAEASGGLRGGLSANMSTGEVRITANGGGFFLTGVVNTLERFRVFNGGNFAIGTTTDAGFKLDVNGTARVQGNATIFGSITATANGHRLGNLEILTSGSAGATGQGILITGVDSIFQLQGSGVGAIPETFRFMLYNGITATQTITNNDKAFIRIYGGFREDNLPNLSGNTLWLSPTYNFTGTRTGMIARGIYYNPTLTSLTSTTHRAIETTTGDVCLGTTSGNVLIGTATSGASKLRIVGLPTSAAGLSSGDIYSNAGILTIVP